MSKITKSAKGEECQIRIPMICNYNPETTVACHLGGGGMGMKKKNLFIAYGCSDCHDAVDGRYRTDDYNPNQLKIFFYEGVFRTQEILLEKGLIKI